MWWTIALVSLFTAVVAMFSKEFSQIGKRIFAIPGGKVIIPLFLASAFVSVFAHYLWVLLTGVRACFKLWEQFIMNQFPGSDVAEFIARVFILMVIACLPMIISLILRKKHIGSGSGIVLQRVVIYSWLAAAILFATVII